MRAGNLTDFLLTSPRMLDAAAREYLDAVEARDATRLRASIARLAPVIEPRVRALVDRQRSMLRRGRVDGADVVQRVFEKMLTHPPTNPADRDPASVILAWAKSVAIHYLLDLTRHFEPVAASGDAVEEAPPAPIAPIQERAVEARQRLALACVCADTHLARHKHLREVFYALADDPDLSARDLAAKLGLAEGGDAAAAKRAEQLVFKLRERVHVKLAECLDRHERALGGKRW